MSERFDPEENDLKKNNISVRPANMLLCLPSQMYVYYDIVEPQLIGDAMAPLLQFSTPQYVPLMKSCFESLDIDLRDHTGSLLPFHFGTSCVKIHFRKASVN